MRGLLAPGVEAYPAPLLPIGPPAEAKCRGRRAVEYTLREIRVKILLSSLALCRAKATQRAEGHAETLSAANGAWHLASNNALGPSHAVMPTCASSSGVRM